MACWDPFPQAQDVGVGGGWGTTSHRCAGGSLGGLPRWQGDGEGWHPASAAWRSSSEGLQGGPQGHLGRGRTPRAASAGTSPQVEGDTRPARKRCPKDKQTWGTGLGEAERGGPGHQYACPSETCRMGHPRDRGTPGAGVICGFPGCAPGAAAKMQVGRDGRCQPSTRSRPGPSGGCLVSPCCHFCVVLRSQQDCQLGFRTINTWHANESPHF